MIQIKLPWPPTLNTYWRAQMVKGRLINMLSAGGRRYRQAAAGALLEQGVIMRGIAGRVAVHIHCCPPDRRKRDLDNLPKGILDALTAGEVWHDDSQVDDLRITRGDIAKPGYVVVSIGPLGEDRC